MPLSEHDALFGAAYQVLFERLDPDGCIDETANAKRMERTVMIENWIDQQSGAVLLAYRRALTEISNRAALVLENNIRARQQMEARKNLPVPPEG